MTKPKLKKAVNRGLLCKYTGSPIVFCFDKRHEELVQGARKDKANPRAGECYHGVVVRSFGRKTNNIMVFHDGWEKNPLVVFSPEYSRPTLNAEGPVGLKEGCYCFAHEQFDVQFEHAVGKDLDEGAFE